MRYNGILGTWQWQWYLQIFIPRTKACCIIIRCKLSENRGKFLHFPEHPLTRIGHGLCFLLDNVFSIRCLVFETLRRVSTELSDVSTFSVVASWLLMLCPCCNRASKFNFHTFKPETTTRINCFETADPVSQCNSLLISFPACSQLQFNNYSMKSSRTWTHSQRGAESILSLTTRLSPILVLLYRQPLDQEKVS